MDAAEATEDPHTAANTAQATTVADASPPRQWPTQRWPAV
jgi:hypothetical protein